MALLSEVGNRIKKAALSAASRAQEAWQNYMRVALDEIEEEILNEAINRAPDGSEKPDLFPTRLGERPSVRLGNVPLKEGLTSSVDFRGTTVGRIFTSVGEIIIRSSSFHAPFFTKGVPEKWTGGTKPHRIPSEGIMANRGYPMTFHFQRLGENWFVRTQIGIHGGLHPGVREGKFGDFMADAYNTVKPDIPGIIRRNLIRIGR